MVMALEDWRQALEGIRANDAGFAGIAKFFGCAIFAVGIDAIT